MVQLAGPGPRGAGARSPCQGWAALAAAPRRQHRRPGHALMGTMDFKTDASAVTINLLLIVRPEEAASKEKGQREGQTEGGRGAGNSAPAAGEGGQGCGCTRRTEAAALEQGLGFLLLFARTMPNSKMPTFLQKPSVSPLVQQSPAGAPLRAAACPAAGRAAPGGDTRGHQPQSWVCTLLYPAPAPRCPTGSLGCAMGAGRGLGSFQHSLPWSTGAEVFCL